MGSARKGKSAPQLRSRQTRSTKGRLLTSADPATTNQLLTTQLRALGLYAADTLGDGNCLFRALSDQLYGSPSRHHVLRTRICDWIEAHRERYEPFVEDERGLETHLRCMRENGTYGGHMELSAFAHMERRDVKVVQPGLVYVIEWRAFASPVASPKVKSKGYQYQYDEDEYDEDGDGDYGEDEDDDGKVERECRRARRQWEHDAEEKHTNGGKAKYIKDKDPPSSPCSPSSSESTIYVAYHDWEHFSSIRNLRGPHTGLPCVRETPPPVQSSSVPPPSPKKKEKIKASSKVKSKSKTDIPTPTPTPTPTLTSTQDIATPVPTPAAAASAPTKLKITLKLGSRPSTPQSQSTSSATTTTTSIDPTTVPLPSSRAASPFAAPNTSSTGTGTSVVAPHPLRASYLPSSSSLVPVGPMDTGSPLSSLPPSPSPEPGQGQGQMQVPTPPQSNIILTSAQKPHSHSHSHHAHQHQPRASPKRALDVDAGDDSECSVSVSGSSTSTSISTRSAKRSRLRKYQGDDSANLGPHMAHRAQDRGLSPPSSTSSVSTSAWSCSYPYMGSISQDTQDGDAKSVSMMSVSVGTGMNALPTPPSSSSSSASSASPDPESDDDIRAGAGAGAGSGGGGADADADVDADADADADDDEEGESEEDDDEEGGKEETPHAQPTRRQMRIQARERARLNGTEREKPLTRRQRKALGLPKARASLPPSGSGVGKIVVPGGRFRRSGPSGVGGEGEGEGDRGTRGEGEEWVKNGTGRVDVRGFRELKI